MATPFKWDITDAEGDLTSEQSDGEVDLSGVKPVKGVTWKIETPDTTISIETVSGGVVEGMESENTSAETSLERSHKPRATREAKSFNQKVIIIVLIVLGVGFLAVVTKGVINGTLDFQAYTIFVLSLLAAFGFKSTGGVDKGSREDKKNDTS